MGQDLLDIEYWQSQNIQHCNREETTTHCGEGRTPFGKEALEDQLLSQVQSGDINTYDIYIYIIKKGYIYILYIYIYGRSTFNYSA